MVLLGVCDDMRQTGKIARRKRRRREWGSGIPRRKSRPLQVSVFRFYCETEESRETVWFVLLLSRAALSAFSC